jgi:hypothetical protein
LEEDSKKNQTWKNSWKKKMQGEEDLELDSEDE